MNSGQIIAIVGHSGSGKSTICSLLERFYDRNSGTITIDGVDINDLSPKWLRSKAIGYISQVIIGLTFLNLKNFKLKYSLKKGANFVCNFNIREHSIW